MVRTVRLCSGLCYGSVSDVDACVIVGVLINEQNPAKDNPLVKFITPTPLTPTIIILLFIIIFIFIITYVKIGSHSFFRTSCS
jgi:hypothetical protein